MPNEDQPMNQGTWEQAVAANPAFVDAMYAKYQTNPNTVDASWYFLFRALDAGQQPDPFTATSEACSELRIRDLINAYRTYGHLQAQFNPIATHTVEEPFQLKLETLGFKPEELSTPFPTLGLFSSQTAPLQEIIDTLKNIYCATVGIEYMGLDNPELEQWIRQQIEPAGFHPPHNIDQKRMILHHLNRSELFESFLHTKYTGQKRFSLEGGETLIPMLESAIEIGAQLGAEEYIIGMAHRGRLNVLSNILKKSHAVIFSEFEEGYIPNSFEGSGDVKYHKGFYSEVTMPDQKKVRISLAPNPSHLESVDPVVEGQTLARQLQTKDSTQKKVIPILIHGDAALSGQGVIYETLQLYRLPGYSTGGTVHFVINNQIGFTATPEESRSTRYCTDIAHAFSAPVFHVNAEDPEGCVFAAILAMKIRNQFHCDVFVDLNCYRKHGHNETDEPAYTQPLEYQLIRQKKPIREIYRDQLIHEGVVEKQLAEQLEKEFTEGLLQAQQEAKSKKEKTSIPKTETTVQGQSQAINTSVPKKVLKSIAEKLSQVSEGFQIHPKLNHFVQERLGTIGEESKPIDWGTAELLAYGSILWDGLHIRLSGQDSVRGTFSHRHAAWKDQVVDQVYTPLNHLKPDQGRFDVFNSSLSEYAALGFEFGYSVGYPNALVIWEAQFGDFSNGAQVIIDQYIATAEQKWGLKFGLVLFLPHGYEGQGPEHSSGRMERFLALAGEDNMNIVNPTTPAQFFHLLRRQVLNPIRKPLIVFTPKGLLRNPACVSTIADLSQGNFQEFLDDPGPGSDVKRLVLCCGRIYYDLIAAREQANISDLAIIRIEQLYPLHIEKLKMVLAKYKTAKKFFWVQEEPINMGAWEFIHPLLQPLLPINLEYIGRSRSASPAVGSYAMHKKQHTAILESLFAEKGPKGQKGPNRKRIKDEG